MEPLLTLREVSMRLNIPTRSVYKLIKEGRLKSSKLGKLLRVKESELCLFIDGLPQKQYFGGNRG